MPSICRFWFRCVFINFRGDHVGVVRECGGSPGQTCNHKYKQLHCIANYKDILLQLVTTVDSNLTQTQDSNPDDREPSMIPLKKVIDLREPKRRLGQKSRADYEA